MVSSNDMLAAARRGQWSVDADIDWCRNAVPPRWMRRSSYVSIVSQFYYGELATQRLCRRLLEDLADGNGRAAVAWQLGDETRHAVAFSRYLERLGDIAPVEEGLETALERSLAWQGSSAALIAAFHVVFEGGALALLQKLVKRFPCPLFAGINERLVPDEARHIAFGKRYLREQVPQLDPDERQEIFAWLRDVWGEAARSSRREYSGFIGRAFGLDPDWAAASWRDLEQVLAGLGFDVVTTHK